MDTLLKTYPSTIRFFAYFFMLIDHIGLVFFPNDPIYRLFGRFSFPLFAFMSAQGYLYTSNLYSYFKRLFILFCISQPIYVLYLSYGILPQTSQFNVILTLITGLILICFYDSRSYVTLFFCIISLFFLKTLGFQMSYGPYGALLVLCAHVFRFSSHSLFLSFSLLTASLIYLGELPFIQILAPFALFFVFLPFSIPFNFRKFGYYFYPAHLLLILCIYCLLS